MAFCDLLAVVDPVMHFWTSLAQDNAILLCDILPPWSSSPMLPDSHERPTFSFSLEPFTCHNSGCHQSWILGVCDLSHTWCLRKHMNFHGSAIPSIGIILKLYLYMSSTFPPPIPLKTLYSTLTLKPSCLKASISSQDDDNNGDNSSKSRNNN